MSLAGYAERVETQLTSASTSGASAGAMLNAGAPVWGLDWAPGSQHVAVSTCASDPAMGSRTKSKGSVQVWSAAGECQVILCTEAEVCALKWMPVGVDVSWSHMQLSS